MPVHIAQPVLKGAKALVVGIANESSIAYGIARAFHELGADLALSYLNDKARPHVEPLARELGASIFMPLDVSVPGELEALFATIGRDWGQLDILVHSIAFAPKDDLQGGLLNCSAEGFAQAMDVSCHSFVRMARLAAPLMKNGGTMMAMSYHGATKVVPTYSVMGPVKAALEACCRYLAYELGGQGIRVHAISPGPAEDARGRGPEGFRPAAHRGRAACADRRAGRHHGRGLRLRLPGHAVRAPPVRRDAVRGRRRQHHGLTTRSSTPLKD
jgi:enoyl-[acyl-carrier protein] reductase I